MPALNQDSEKVCQPMKNERKEKGKEGREKREGGKKEGQEINFFHFLLVSKCFN